jgi:NAD-dependent dihydropyrimidine dehydrogenase PreA subunit
MKSIDSFDYSQLKIPLIMMAIFWMIAVVLWLMTGRIFYLCNFGYIGTALGLGIGIYSALPRKHKLWGRRLAQFLVGAYMLVFLGFIQRENMQMEGFIFYILSGLFAGSVIHYLVAKIAGPLVFNRGWCGWACWTVMVLDLLPYKRNKKGRLSGNWGYLRYIHFALSLGLVAILWWGFNYRVKDQSLVELYWLLAGNILYYTIGIFLAYKLQDNRAFCKYVCPIPTLQKITSRFALIKISSQPEKCNDCGACNKMCPMDIRVSEYVLKNQRVLSTECIMCLECVNACSKGALGTSIKFDH